MFMYHGINYNCEVKAISFVIATKNQKIIILWQRINLDDTLDMVLWDRFCPKEKRPGVAWSVPQAYPNIQESPFQPCVVEFDECRLEGRELQGFHQKGLFTVDPKEFVHWQSFHSNYAFWLKRICAKKKAWQIRLSRIYVCVYVFPCWTRKSSWIEA